MELNLSNWIRIFYKMISFLVILFPANSSVIKYIPLDKVLKSNRFSDAFIEVEICFFPLTS